ncbi:ABC transporter ATP-binding protein [Sulfurovum lithotrophicum]|uniref:ABC transporter ATP-binding protein n=1 Tax=Sulfurovum lithotrophicum TaxID=206403 RepID=A0A7U4LZI9_9BACT|nr:ABC transporter ATP-binding protein [Sulfurovum lithotrophicum]AKF24123.1 ABC transporter ATP-binding protein [Sulfurovum lithotrophicum]
MIELRNVTKYFLTNEDQKYILDDVTMTLPEINIGILGRNGSGKSTLMRMLGKIEFPNRGSIYSKKSFSWPLGLSGGSVPNMTGKANIKFVCTLYNKTHEETRKIIEYVKDFAELGDYFDMPIKTYSSGMKGRLGFGLSLAFDFDYMLIDETLSTGDASFKEKAQKALREKIAHCHILLVSHNMKTLSELCQAGLLLHEGKLYYYEDIDDAINRYKEINRSKGST